MSVGEKIKQNKKKSREFIHQLYYKNRINFIAAIILTIAMSSLNLMISWLIQQIMDSMANQNMQAVVRCAWLAISGKGVTAGVVIVFVQLMNYNDSAQKTPAVRKNVRGMNAPITNNATIIPTGFPSGIVVFSWPDVLQNAVIRCIALLFQEKHFQ